MGDCHLGSWRQPELKELNMRSFRYVIDFCIRNKADFVLISGDLFDSAYPPIDILKEAFKEFRRLKEAEIPVFLIAGSHDYSVSGKTFLDVLENSGFCKNVSIFQERGESIILEPTIYKNVALYGYPGKKSGLEIEEVKRIKLQDSPGLFKILLLHTSIRGAISNPMIESIDESTLPKVDYLALSHLHIIYAKNGIVYSGPTFPNNLSEVEELKFGSFYIFDKGNIKREEIKLIDVVSIRLEVTNALQATKEILEKMENLNLNNKILVLRISGILETGKTSDIDFLKIEKIARERGAYTILKSTSKLHVIQSEVKIDLLSSESLENDIIKKFEEGNQHKFNSLIFPLIKTLQLEKADEEKSTVFKERLLSEIYKIIKK